MINRFDGKDRPALENQRSERRRGRPQGEIVSPLGQVILKAMKALNRNYKVVVNESTCLAKATGNDDMRIGKSTLGNIISGRIRQPSTAKLDSLRTILHLSQLDVSSALGLQPERRLKEHLRIKSSETHEISTDVITRQRRIKLPVLKRDSDLNHSQFLSGCIEHWSNVDVEYLCQLYPPYLCYVIVGENDRFASPIAPPGTRLLVNTLLTTVPESDKRSFHQRELFYVLTPRGNTCCYLEYSGQNRIVLIPHP